MKNFINLLLIALLICSCSVKNKQSDSGQMRTAQNEMTTLIRLLVKDSKLHKDIEPKLSDAEIKKAENQLGMLLPNSYKQFLKEFGNGAYWLYAVDQPINGVNKEFGTIHMLGKISRLLRR